MKQLFKILYRPINRRQLQVQILKEYIEAISNWQIMHCGVFRLSTGTVFHFEDGYGWHEETLDEFLYKSKFGVDAETTFVKEHSFTIEEQHDILQRLEKLCKQANDPYCFVTNNCETQLNVVLYGKRVSEQSFTYLRSICDHIVDSIVGDEQNAQKDEKQ